MAKKESTFLNMVLTLSLVSLLASGTVAFVYEATKGPKAAADLAKKINAIREVVPEFTNNPLDEEYRIVREEGALVCYPAKNNGELVGTAVETFSAQGFGGEIKLMVGLLPDGSIYDVAVIEHKETPGLGDKMEKKKSRFSEQFRGKNPGSFILSVKKDGGNVDGITAATISSRAYCDAVRKAFLVYQGEGNGK
ncbi:MAG: RnfABCDGE type electron transport complex subunit G [Candidatus Omnitrophota bacterium]